MPLFLPEKLAPDKNKIKKYIINHYWTYKQKSKNLSNHKFYQPNLDPIQITNY